MKEIDLFSKWADSVVETRMGTPIKAMADRPLPRQIDIQYKAERAYPELSPEQALARFLDDELEQNEKIDKQQNKQINAIDHEVDKVEHDEEELQSQFSRLLQLLQKQ